MAHQYDWVTSDMFAEKLEELVHNMSAKEILSVPGCYEALAEELNNDVLDALEEERNKVNRSIK